MVDFAGRECDMCMSREDGVRRLPLSKPDGEDAGDFLVDLCAGCWNKHNLDLVFAKARPAPKQQQGQRAARGDGHRVIPEETRRIKKWCQANDIEWKAGPVPNDVRVAWRDNDPSQVKHRYMGNGEPAEVGVMPPDARPEGWTEAAGQG